MANSSQPRPSERDSGRASGLDPRAAGPQPPFPAQEQGTPGSVANMDPFPDHGERSYRGLGRLRDKIAVVTGGDSGIGRAAALAFAREGADVAIGYLDEHADADAARQSIEESGRNALTVAGDLASDEQCRHLIEKATDAFGRIDILVNSAAYQGESVSLFEELTPERVARSFEVNIIAMFNLTRHALPFMQAGGCIINTASIQAYEPSPGILDYAATKGAIVTFTKGLAKHLSERGIRVNAVAPGPVWTPLIAQSFSAEKTAHFGENAPMGRPSQPAELAPSYVFLASDEARYVNGEILAVTGGKRLS